MNASATAEHRRWSAVPRDVPVVAPSPPHRRRLTTLSQQISAFRPNASDGYCAETRHPSDTGLALSFM